MTFRLTYDGPLHANGSKEEKQDIRRVIHRQIRELRRLRGWEPQPPDFNVVSHEPGGGVIPLAFRTGKFTFLPLITRQLKLVAGLDILFLRRQEPGAIVSSGGDIDNRVKTLLDALRIPRTPDEIPDGDSPAPDETPFCSLLEDDVLVTKLAIDTDRLLEPALVDRQTSHVRLVIRVDMMATSLTWDNLMML